MNGKPEAYAANSDSAWATTPEFLWIENPDALRAYARTLRDKLSDIGGDQLTRWHPDHQGEITWLESGENDTLCPFTDPHDIQLTGIVLQVTLYDLCLISSFQHTKEEVFIFLPYEVHESAEAEEDAARYTPEGVSI